MDFYDLLGRRIIINGSCFQKFLISRVIPNGFYINKNIETETSKIFVK